MGVGCTLVVCIQASSTCIRHTLQTLVDPDRALAVHASTCTCTPTHTHASQCHIPAPQQIHTLHHTHCTTHRWLKNISIPAVFVTKSTGDVLKNLLKEKKEVYVSLDWNDALPRKKTVDWEFWTNSNDMCGAVCDVQQEFIRVGGFGWDGGGWVMGWRVMDGCGMGCI